MNDEEKRCVRLLGFSPEDFRMLRPCMPRGSLAESLSATTAGGMWEWAADDQGRGAVWQAYRQDDCGQLEAALANGDAHVVLNHGTKTVLVDFRTMEQENTTTKFKRKVRRKAATLQSTSTRVEADCAVAERPNGFCARSGEGNRDCAMESAPPPVPEAVPPAAARRGPPSPPESGAWMEEWTKNLDPSLFCLGVGSTSAGQCGVLSQASLFSRIPPENKTALAKRLSETEAAQRTPVAKAVGSLVALAAADATGHWFEFMDVCDKPGVNRGGSVYNKFSLQMGQWTDDTSMALAMARRPLICLFGSIQAALFAAVVFSQLEFRPVQEALTMTCMFGQADSLLIKGEFDGSDIRTRFWNWWYRGYCNAFGKDTSSAHPRVSIGLGGNISKSLKLSPGHAPPPRFESLQGDSGNGSLMRLAPIAIFYSSDVEQCMHYARESSYTTHPGHIAAECCALLSFLIAKAIHDPALPISTDGALSARGWLETQAEEFLHTVLAERSGDGVDQVRQLLQSSEPEGSLERNWNWRATAEDGLQIEATLRARGSSYNGHPVSFGYFGSYAMDGLAVALHCVASTSSLNAALERCINFLGDADSTGAIVGQLAGAIYGIGALHSAFVDNLQQWDDGEVAVRAYMLHFGGQEFMAGLRPSSAGSVKETNMVEEEQAYAALAAGKHLWRRHYVGDREFWRRAGMDPVSGQRYTKEEKDASICSALPDAGVDAVVSPAKNEGTADANRAWFDMHWALMASVVPASMDPE